MSIYRMMEMQRLGLSPEYAVYNKGGGGGSKSTSTTTSKPYQQAQYGRLLGEATNWLNQGGFDQYYGGSADFNPNASMNQTQQAGIEGLTSGGQNIQGLLDTQGYQSLNRVLGQYDPEASGLNAAISAANRTLQRDFNQTVLPQIGNAAVDAGQVGSTRQGVAQGIAAQGLADAMTSNAQGLAFQDYQNFTNNQLNALGNLSAISKGLLSGSAAQYDAGTLQQQQQQQQINADLQKWAYENNVDLNTLLAYKELISGNMGGKNVTTTETSGGGGSGLGAAIGSLGGAAVGGMYGGAGGAGVGSGVGGQIGGLLF